MSTQLRFELRDPADAPKAVCTGAVLAAKAGVLDNRAATTNKEGWKHATKTGPNTYWVSHARWVASADMKVWSTSGVSAGTDGFLAFLDHVYKAEKGKAGFVDQICASMEYTRVAESQNDPWGVFHDVADVPPHSWHALGKSC